MSTYPLKSLYRFINHIWGTPIVIRMPENTQGPDLLLLLAKTAILFIPHCLSLLSCVISWHSTEDTDIYGNVIITTVLISN